MDFSLTAEQEALRQEAKQFADEVLKPGAGERDREHVFPEAMIQAAAEKGYLGLLVPQQFGGRDVGNMGQCLVLEELARADASTHVTISVHNSLVTGPIKQLGSDALQQRWLPRLAKGEAIGAYALTEPHAGSDAASLSCAATQDGDGWVLNGTKLWITTGERADVMVVFARTDKEAPKAKGITAFAVDCDQPGLTCGKPENKTGLRASQTVQVFLEDVKVPGDALLGEVNRGFNYAMGVLNGGRVGIATQAVGIAQAALDVCLETLGARRRDGKPVRPTQDEDFRLAEMATKIEASRLMVWRAAMLRDAGADHIREASMAKLMASQTCNQVCREAVALLGARGWRAEGEIERIFRDARITEIYEGTTEVQKLVIARTLWGR